MARPRRATESHAVDPVATTWEWRALRSLLMASEPGSPAAAKSALIRGRADKIAPASSRPSFVPTPGQLAELWAFIGELGLPEAAERHLAHLRAHRERRLRAV